MQARLILAFFLLCLGSAHAEVQLSSNHPTRYVVQQGDTLWDIATRFLNQPWQWPEIWHINPQLANPHKIFPGDELELVWIDGKPRIQLNPGDRVVKLTPRIRPSAWDGAIPSIPIDAIAPFLNQTYAVDKKAMDDAPYVVAFADEHIIGGASLRAYVKGIDGDQPRRFDVLRPTKELRDYDSGELLAHQGLYIGTARLVRTGNPATVFISRGDRDMQIGDRLIPSEEDVSVQDVFPHKPDQDIDGSIIDLLGGVSQFGRNSVVVIDRGRVDGLNTGTILNILKRGEVIHDRFAEPVNPEIVLNYEDGVPQVVSGHEQGIVTKLPDEVGGVLLIYRVFERVSFGLVMSSQAALHLGDRVTNP